MDVFLQDIFCITDRYVYVESEKELENNLVYCMDYISGKTEIVKNMPDGFTMYGIQCVVNSKHILYVQNPGDEKNSRFYYQLRLDGLRVEKCKITGVNK